MAKVEQPLFILPKKRNGKKSNAGQSHVDHILSIQGATESETSVKYRTGLPSSIEHAPNGIIHSTMDGLKSNMKINLPIITDVNDEDTNESYYENNQKDQNVQRSGCQTFSLSNNREALDLSPIYENSSDACSSHDDLKSSNDNEIHKSCRLLNSDHYESSSATPNSLSQTQSEYSFEMGPVITDSLKNSAKRKKRVNIVPEIIETENTDTEITALRVESEISLSPECSLTENTGYLTMTGTIKRGKKKGQNVDVKLNISREELEIIEAAIVAEEYNKIDISKCSLYNGPHIFLYTLLCTPFVACISAVYSFYVGTMTWYSIFSHISEEFNCIKKALLAPLLILSYPFLIIIFTVGLGLYAGITQITFSGTNWWKDVCDLEKGFYGWLCNKLSLSECSPYEVVVLMDLKPS